MGDGVRGPRPGRIGARTAVASRWSDGNGARLGRINMHIIHVHVIRNSRSTIRPYPAASAVALRIAYHSGVVLEVFVAVCAVRTPSM